jgi:hypothetical protein
MPSHQTFLRFACRAAAFSFVLAATASVMQAQSAASTTAGFERSPFVASAYANPFGGMVSNSSSSSSSSSSAADVDALTNRAALGAFDLKSSQPPPRRRYGRPNYSDKNTNKDGSSKWTGLVGGGFTLPVGNTHKYETTSWAFQGGIGRNFSKTAAVLLQFDYDQFGLQNAIVNNESLLYLGATGQGFGGNNHVWSFSIDPTFTIPTEGSLGAYVVVGAGFYHKVTNFTLPQTQCLDYYCQFTGTVNVTCGAICHYTSNAPGFNGGLGVTWKFSKFSNERLYAEARYVYIDNSQRTGLTLANSTTPPYGTPSNPGGTYTGFNAYPANSNRTSYIPVKFGIRF